MNQRFEFEFLIAHKLNSNLYSLFVDLLLCFSSSSSYHYYYYYFLLLFFFLVLVQTSTLAFTSSISPTGNVSDVPKVQQSSSCIVPTSTAKMTTTGEMFFFLRLALRMVRLWGEHSPSTHVDRIQLREATSRRVEFVVSSLL